MELLSQVNGYAGIGYNDVWGYTAADGREYALLGVRNGTSIIDISDDNNAVEIAFVQGSGSIWKDIKVFKDYAYVVTEARGGMQIIDLSGLPEKTLPVTTFRGFLKSHNIFIDEENALLFSQGSNEQGSFVRIFSLEDPRAPRALSQFGIECHDVFVQDQIAYVAEGNQSTFGIYDVSNPETPKYLKRIPVPGGGYAHNTWLTPDSKYLLTTEETQGKTVKLWDIQDFNQITLKENYLGASGMAHNVHVKGNYAYISHYNDGLKIVEITDDPPGLVEVASYDSYPGTDLFGGSWGAYPFFKSGKILLSDISTGLYVLYFKGAEENDQSHVKMETAHPKSMILHQNYPNPFSRRTRAGTVIQFDLLEDARVNVAITDLKGTHIKTLVRGRKSAGNYTTTWNGQSAQGTKVPSGVYFYTMTIEGARGTFKQTKKCTLLK